MWALPVSVCWWPSRHPTIDTAQRVVVRQASGLDLGLGRWAHDLKPLASQRCGGREVLGVVDGLVFGPDSLVVGDDAPIAKHRDRCKSAVISIRRPITEGCTE
jgi:hypothetical protein